MTEQRGKRCRSGLPLQDCGGRSSWLSWPSGKATISQLTNRPSAYLQRVRAGETILVLDRDTPVARIESVARNTSPDERLRRLERAGILWRAVAPLSLAALKADTPRASRSVVRALLDDRAEGR